MRREDLADLHGASVVPDMLTSIDQSAGVTLNVTYGPGVNFHTSAGHLTLAQTANTPTVRVRACSLPLSCALMSCSVCRLRYYIGSTEPRAYAASVLSRASRAGGRGTEQRAVLPGAQRPGRTSPHQPHRPGVAALAGCERAGRRPRQRRGASRAGDANMIARRCLGHALVCTCPGA